MSHATLSRPLFNVGRVVATPGATDALDWTSDNVATLLWRHQNGDDRSVRTVLLPGEY